MQIVIEIPKSEIPKYQDIIEIPLHFIDGKVCEAGGYGFDVLPKGHGRIIDESQIRHIECHTEQDLYGNKIHYVKATDAPTIIEADKCTYNETGCGSCKRQLDCPIEADRGK